MHKPHKQPTRRSRADRRAVHDYTGCGNTPNPAQSRGTDNCMLDQPLPPIGHGNACAGLRFASASLHLGFVKEHFELERSATVLTSCLQERRSFVLK